MRASSWGPRAFYDALHRMNRSEREDFCMTGIAIVNQLYGQEELKRLQRRHVRFVNTGLIVTLSGAVNSDALEDGRVLSGVGGQYNFVTMAHALEDGRSILLIRSTREDGATLKSSIRGTYLERMRLDAPQTLNERLLQRALVYALASVNVI
jgi:acyl-CoA hydrolase